MDQALVAEKKKEFIKIYLDEKARLGGSNPETTVTPSIVDNWFYHVEQSGLVSVFML